MKLQLFLREALRLVNVPYVYGGRLVDKGGGLGVDCWGLIAIAAVKAGGPVEWRSWWTDVAFQKLAPEYEAKPGTLSFYGGHSPTDVSHVALHVGNGLILTTTRGDSTVTNVETARKKNARVTLYTVDEYARMRLDFRGMRKIPFEYQEGPWT